MAPPAPPPLCTASSSSSSATLLAGTTRRFRTTSSHQPHPSPYPPASPTLPHEDRRSRDPSGASSEWASGFSSEGYDVAASSSGPGSASGSDSAYGTFDEGDEHAWRQGDKVTSAPGPPTTATTRRRERGQASTRSRSVGDAFLWSTSALERTPSGSGQSSSPTLNHPGVFAVDINYDADTSFDSVESLGSTASSSSTGPSGYRSSPEPSESEFELDQLVTSAAKKRRRLISRNNSPPQHDDDDRPLDASSPGLSRRHTLPRRRSRVRSASTSIVAISIVSASSSSSSLASSAPPPPFLPSTSSARQLAVRLPPVTLLSLSLTLSLSLLSILSPVPLLLPASPVHLLHPQKHLLLEYANAALSPFLIPSSSLPALALSAANLVSLKSLEDSASRRTMKVKLAALGSMWAAIVGLRVLLSWVFGRVLGWAHPELFSTNAIHEVGAGFAPLLLALSIVRAFSSPASSSRRSATAPFVQLLLLAANFCTPIEQGGTGFWFGLCGATVGVVVCAALFIYDTLVARSMPSTFVPSPRRKRSVPVVLPPPRRRPSLALFALLFFPILTSLISTPPLLPPSANLDHTFSSLHPSSPHLLTILLMTAPRPGSPDFLLRTIESYLGALPSPSLSSSSTSRLRLLVYTHFATHETFDAAQAHFATSSIHGDKAAQYLQWYRDPRADANRLDQRLHVARGLEFASRDGGESAYVLLAEDDFPLCPDEDPEVGKRDYWDQAWRDLQTALVKTNLAMPDRTEVDEDEESAGHCGLFVATGGSGLVMRGFLAQKLPALLLGADDPQGLDRDARARRGEFSVKHEDQGADTPDLVIQDCLRGRLPECAVCAPPERGLLGAKGATRFPEGSARNGGGKSGDRWGKSGLAGTERLVQHHLGYNASTLPGRKYGKEEWACGWRQPFNGEPDILTV